MSNVRSIESSSVQSAVSIWMVYDHIVGTHIATAIAEFLHRWVLDCTAGITDAVPTLLLSGMGGGRVIVGCSGCHLIR